MKFNLENLVQKTKKIGKSIIKPVIGTAITTALVFGLLVPKEAKAATLNQWVYPDSSQVTIFNQDHNDSVLALTGQFVKNYWSRTLPAGWNVLIGDSGTVKIKSLANDISNIKWFCRAASDLLPTAFAGKYSISVRDVSNSADTVTAKCYKKGGLDTLTGVFDITTSPFAYEIYFDASSLGLNNEDSVFIDAYAPGEHGQTKGKVQHRFIDADTLARFNLIVGIPEEHRQSKPLEYQVYPTITSGYVNIKGTNKVNVYDISGRNIGHYEGNATSNGFNFEMSAPVGVYILKPENPKLPGKKIVKTKN